jgi:hypothetical protein
MHTFVRSPGTALALGRTLGADSHVAKSTDVKVRQVVEPLTTLDADIAHCILRERLVLVQGARQTRSPHQQSADERRGHQRHRAIRSINR